MDKKDFEAQKIRELYHTPGCADHQLRPKNAIYISGSNTLRHELAKCIGAYMLRKYGDIPEFDDWLKEELNDIDETVKLLMKDFPKGSSDFITEAVPDDEPNRRVDLVRLPDNQKFEFETDSKIKKSGACTIYI